MEKTVTGKIISVEFFKDGNNKYGKPWELFTVMFEADGEPEPWRMSTFDPAYKDVQGQTGTFLYSEDTMGRKTLERIGKKPDLEPRVLALEDAMKVVKAVLKEWKDRVGAAPVSEPNTAEVTIDDIAESLGGNGTNN
jgi:hypothetical protein